MIFDLTDSNHLKNHMSIVEVDYNLDKPLVASYTLAEKIEKHFHNYSLIEILES